MATVASIQQNPANTAIILTQALERATGEWIKRSFGQLSPIENIAEQKAYLVFEKGCKQVMATHTKLLESSPFQSDFTERRGRLERAFTFLSTRSDFHLTKEALFSDVFEMYQQLRQDVAPDRDSLNLFKTTFNVLSETLKACPALVKWEEDGGFYVSKNLESIKEWLDCLDRRLETDRLLSSLSPDDTISESPEVKSQIDSIEADLRSSMEEQA